MLEYPKIETLYNRDDKTRAVITNAVRLPEFNAIRQWSITEKIDGTNIRIGLHENGSVEYGGRTANAQLPATLVKYLQETFTPDKMQAAFVNSGDGMAYPEVVLFGEGYGPKIQNGGGYRRDVSFRLFDVLVGNWWLERDAVEDIADKLGIYAVPMFGSIAYSELPTTAQDLADILGGGESYTARIEGGTGCRAEGVVARSIPMLFNRRGERVMWKLKFKDFK